MSIARQIQEEQGWTDTTLLDVLLDYIANQQSDIALEDYLRTRCAEEDEEDEDLCVGVADDFKVGDVLDRVRSRWEEINETGTGYDWIDAVADVLRGEDLAMHVAGTHGIYRDGPGKPWGPCRVGCVVWNRTPQKDRRGDCNSIQEARQLAVKLNREEVENRLGRPLPSIETLVPPDTDAGRILDAVQHSKLEYHLEDGQIAVVWPDLYLHVFASMEDYKDPETEPTHIHTPHRCNPLTESP